jgi:hypothetical protein
MRWMWAVVVTLSGMASAQAFTCADVRALSAAQQAYYIKVLDITPAQQEQIRHACYGGRTRHAIAVADERQASRQERGEPNARTGE